MYRNYKHWLSNTRFYGVRENIWSRCYNPKSDSYIWYWWRGIRVDRESFQDFARDMYESYKKHVEIYWEKNTSIDRNDTNKNYCKDNCKWATNKEQSINKANTRYMIYGWERLPMLIVAARMGIKYKTLRQKEKTKRLKFIA